MPSIGVHLLKKTWSGEIRSWESPNVSDEGISLLQDILSEFLPKNGKVGLPSGPETLLRMPLVYFNQIRSSLDKLHFVSDCEIVKNLRLIKSQAEVEKIIKVNATKIFFMFVMFKYGRKVKDIDFKYQPVIAIYLMINQLVMFGCSLKFGQLINNPIRGFIEFAGHDLSYLWCNP